jgi:glucose-1-phosphate adenylyltransferase
MQLRVLGIILAGGKGTRLYPLTRDRAKPAVPFGGEYRIIDFVLSNFVNSGIFSIYVLTQFRSQSLLQHLSEGWQMGGLSKNQFIIPVPAQMRSSDESWYQGTADAVYQNINLIEQAAPDVVAIFGADHIYRMNIAQMIDFHQKTAAVCTVAAIPVQCPTKVEGSEHRSRMSRPSVREPGMCRSVRHATHGHSSDARNLALAKSLTDRARFAGRSEP